MHVLLQGQAERTPETGAACGPSTTCRKASSSHRRREATRGPRRRRGNCG